MPWISEPNLAGGFRRRDYLSATAWTLCEAADLDREQGCKRNLRVDCGEPRLSVPRKVPMR